MLQASASHFSETSLADLCKSALAKASACKEPILTCFAFPLGSVDPFLWAEEASKNPDIFRFFWARPEVDISMAAGEEVVRLKAEGTERFAQMAGEVDDVFSRSLSGGVPTGGPFALGGFSFFDAPEPGLWDNFPPGLMVIPAWMVIRQKGKTTGMVSTLVHQADTPQKLETHLTALMNQVKTKTKRESPPPSSRPVFTPIDEGDGKPHWFAMMDKALNEIQSGRLEKITLAHSLDLSTPGGPPFAPILSTLQKTFPNCYTFLVAPGGGGVFLGASPERLAKFSEEGVELAALASSAPRGPTPEADKLLGEKLLNSEKERMEHQFVVETIVKNVAEIGEVVFSATPQVAKFSNVQHLFTPISLKPHKPLPLLSLLERLHPTPAVGGLPREPALKKIRELENFERGWYAAPVGWINAAGEGEFAVALRSGLFQGQKARLFAGNGIVAESEPEQEFRETQLKFQALLAGFARE